MSLSCASLSTVHSHGIIHGNLSGVRIISVQFTNQSDICLKNNVLVDALGRASLADPGLSVLVPEVLGMSYFRLSTSGAIRFAAPELFKKSSRGEVPLPSISGDRYSLGSIIYLVSPSLRKLRVLSINYAGPFGLATIFYLEGQ